MVRKLIIVLACDPTVNEGLETHQLECIASILMFLPYGRIIVYQKAYNRMQTTNYNEIYNSYKI